MLHVVFASDANQAEGHCDIVHKLIIYNKHTSQEV